MRTARFVSMFLSLTVFVTVVCHVAAQDQVYESMPHLTPALPAAQDVACHVEVPTVNRMTGHCAPLGSSGRLACHAGIIRDATNDVCRRLQHRLRHSRRRHQRRPRQ